MPKTFRVSDESVNAHGCRVLSAGGDTTAFVSNPVMLYMHQRGTVIGQWDNLRLENGAWYADPVFDLEDKALGADIGGKVERGFLKAASLGICFDWADVVYNELLNCCDITKWSFQEISIVDVGSNTNALQLYDMSGEPITELKLAAELKAFTPPTPTNLPPTIPPNPPMALVLATMALAMGLPETATEADVLATATERKAHADAVAELASLKLSIKNAQTADAISLVDAAVADKRIPATSKDLYLKLFAADHDSARAALAGLAKPQSLIQLANTGAAQAESQSETDVKAFDEMDKKGTLATFSTANPDEFKRMYKAKFGVEPK